jgi:hypothetical protein
MQKRRLARPNAANRQLSITAMQKRRLARPSAANRQLSIAAMRKRPPAHPPAGQPSHEHVLMTDSVSRVAQRGWRATWTGCRRVGVAYATARTLARVNPHRYTVIVDKAAFAGAHIEARWTSPA